MKAARVAGAIAVMLFGTLQFASDRIFAEQAIAAPKSPLLESQWKAYQSDVAKSVVELQPFRQSTSVEYQLSGEWGAAMLVNLNPAINAWFLLTLWWPGLQAPISYHLENAFPKTQTLTLNEGHPYGIQILRAGTNSDCELWPSERGNALLQAQRTELPFAPLCQDRLYLRNRVAGAYTHLERITNFLRDHVWGGEKIIGFVRNEFFRDAFLEKEQAAARAAMVPEALRGPGAALVIEPYDTQSILPEHLEIDIGQGRGGILMGRWYPVRDVAGAFVSSIEPKAIATPNLRGEKITAAGADPVEAGAISYLVAFDLSQFDLGFVLGTDHPRVGWSDRVPDSVRDPRLPGPDGIDNVAPLVLNGMINPRAVETTVATFAGGFKREHGAFHSGALAERNHGSHYGFVQQGVIFSKLQPGLSTLLVGDDSSVQMKTWTEADNALLPHIRDARQNGVPLIEYDGKPAKSFAGGLIDSWGAGNWSGSSDEHFRTLRAGVCLQVNGANVFLIYGYFSTATPRAMTRVFQAYGCRYAMHLDMNALEHTYLAIYSRKDGKIAVEHLVEGMSQVDRKGGDEFAPRFLSFPDDRDFFYLTRKGSAP